MAVHYFHPEIYGILPRIERESVRFGPVFNCGAVVKRVKCLPIAIIRVALNEGCSFMGLFDDIIMLDSDLISKESVQLFPLYCNGSTTS